MLVIMTINIVCMIDKLSQKNPAYCGTKIVPINKIYLGEECLTDENCRYGNGLKSCSEVICIASAKPNYCDGHDDCYKGKYCNLKQNNMKINYLQVQNIIFIQNVLIQLIVQNKLVKNIIAQIQLVLLKLKTMKMLIFYVIQVLRSMIVSKINIHVLNLNIERITLCMEKNYRSFASM